MDEVKGESLWTRFIVFAKRRKGYLNRVGQRPKSLLPTVSDDGGNAATKPLP
jgi:hypothetical protein